MKYSERAYRELYSLAGLLEKFNNELKDKEAAPCCQEQKNKILEDIESWSYMLKSYSKQLEDMSFVDDFECSNIMKQKEWSEPKYLCPECGGGMCENLMMIFCSNPPKYQYQCDSCGHIEYKGGMI